MRPRVVQSCAELLRVNQSCENPKKTKKWGTDRRTDGPTDRPTDQWTDTPSYRDARTHLKMGVQTKKIIFKMKNFGYGYACLFIHLWESCIVVMRQYKHIHPTMSLVNFEDATVSHFVGLLVGWSVNQLVSWLVPCLLFPHF